MSAVFLGGPDTARAVPKQGWIQRFRPNPQAALRLICFPYAGGSAQMYASWPGGVPRTVEVVAVQAPAHGMRLLEPPLTNMEDLVAGIVDGLQPELDRPFALFGHSMGGLVAFEVARELRRRDLPTPAKLYVSARDAPTVELEPTAIHRLPDAEFADAIRGYGATPDDVLASAELMRLLAPALRGDFEVCETYEHAPEAPLECPIATFWGIADPLVSRAACEPWREQTASDWSLHMMPGDHFYVHSAERVLLALLARDLGRLAELAPGLRR